MIPKPFDTLERVDIESLVAEGRAEHRTLDYKEKLPNLGLEQDKYEFLFDVCSFANAAGGDILYGVVDKRDANGKPTGIPESSPGVNVPNADAAILQLTQVVRTSIDPKVPGFQMKAIPGFASGPVVLARIPRSYSSPHLVRNDKQWVRFYSRGSNGKLLLDVGEVRAAFALSDSVAERVRKFRAERLARIVADETPLRVGPGPRTVFQLLPIASLDPANRIELTRFEQNVVRPLYATNVSWRYNFDGLVFYRPPSPPEPCPSYVQLFRSGAIEAVETRMTCLPSNKPKLLPVAFWERELIDKLGSYLSVQREMGLAPPIFVLLTLIGVDGYYVPYGAFSDTKESIDRDTLTLPDLLVEDYSTPAAAILRPAFDSVWQAGGWRCSLHYDAEGKWVGH